MTNNSSWWKRAIACAVAVAPLFAPFVAAAADMPKEAGPERVAEASDEGEAAMAGFRLASGLDISLFAAEPHVANIIAMHPDEKGRWYVVEVFRLHQGVPDIRGLMSWLDDDLAARTVEDRLKMHRKHEGDKVRQRTKFSDRVRLVEDSDGDGRVDKASVFSTGYNAIEDGLAAGVLARKGDVWFTNLPHLWKLKDTNGDGVADVKQSLSEGYGVRVGFIGHDLHGLRFGPDGRLYFSMGDRGLNVKTANGTIAYPEAGAVLRCEPDGSNLEIFAMGLRNPQELAFDDYGNLFTGDNNCDAGDPAKWVYVVEGGDSGWRVGYQHMRNAGPWNAERLHALEKDSLAAYHVPPIAHIGNGPSGVAYYPGTGLSSAYDGHFLMVDFKGSPSMSGIYSFAMKPKGASFEMVDKEQFIWGILATDVEFGVDGGAYIGDWVNGWGMTGKGRIYRVTDPQGAQSAIVAETRKLIGEGMEKRSEAELAKLMGHRDQRVRQSAQFELADRGEKASGTLVKVAQAGESQLARIHAMWGLGQVARKVKVDSTPLLPLLGDGDEQIRAQAAKVLGEARFAGAHEGLVKLLEDESARVRFEAAMALGKLKRGESVGPLLEMLRKNDDRDAYVRHAGVMGLVGSNDTEALLKAAADPSAAVRMGVVLALRRMERPEVARFLRDADVKVAAEAARAINDVPIDEAMGELAKLAGEEEAMQRAAQEQGRFILQRALNANYRMVADEGAKRLAAVARSSAAPESLRVEAMVMLANWEKPSGRDRVVGLWRPIPERDGLVVALAIKEDLHGLVHGDAPEAVKIAALRLVEIHGGAKDLAGLVKDVKLSTNLRAAALKAMAMRNDPMLAEAVKAGLVERRGTLRREAIRVSMKLPNAVAEFDRILSEGTPADQQAVFSTLASVEGKAAEEVIARWMDRLLAGEVAAAARLDLLEAAERSKSSAVKEKVKQYEKTLRKEDALAGWRETLVGGDAEAGRRVFQEKTEVSCVRCHRIGGSEVVAGPDLKGVGSRQTREYLLESIVTPNKQVAAGFENVRVKTKGKKTYIGMLKSESADELTLMTEPEPGVVKMVTVKKGDVVSKESQPSSMPEGMEKMLSRREMRDLVEFLAGQKE